MDPLGSAVTVDAENQPSYNTYTITPPICTAVPSDPVCVSRQYLSGNICVACNAAGQYVSGTSCATCSAGQVPNDTYTGCKACDKGSYSSGNSCVACSTGQYVSNNTCATCNATQIPNSTLTGCDACEAPAKYVSGNTCLTGGRYIRIIAPHNTQNLILSNIQVYQSQASMDAGNGLLTPTMPVTSNPSKMFGATLQNIVTPLTAAQIASPDGTANSLMYITLNAAENAYVEIDIGSMQPIYSIVITARLDLVQYALVGCFVQIWNNTKTIYWQSDYFADPNGYTLQKSSYPAFKKYKIYPPSTAVVGEGAVCANGYMSNGNTCNLCGAGSVSNSTNTACISCSAGTRPVNNVCTPCPANYISNSNNSDCVACSGGQVPMNNICVTAGRYIIISTESTTEGITLSQIQVYSSQQNMNNGIGLLSSTSPVTCYPPLVYGATLQNIVTPLTATQIANPDGSANSTTYIHIQAAKS